MTTVVYSSGPGHTVDVEVGLAVLVAPEAQVGPEPGGLDEDVDAPRGRGSRRSPVAPTYWLRRVGDVGVDVVLRGAGRVVGRRLLAVDRAPREERALLGQLAGPLARRGQQRVPEAQRVAGGVRARCRSGTASRRSRCPRSSDRRSPSRSPPWPGCPAPSARAEAWMIEKRFQRTACWSSGWPGELDVGALPRTRRARSRCSANWCSVPSSCGPVQGPLAAVEQLAGGHVLRRVVADRLGQSEGLAGLASGGGRSSCPRRR